MPPDVAVRVAKAAADFWSTAHAPGMAVTIRRGGQEFFSAYFGMADAFKRKPVGAETRFDLGSITKQFTAAAIMRLQETGAVDIDEPVSTYLPGLAVLKDGPRLRHLLGHTGGLRSALEGDMLSSASSTTDAFDVIIEEIAGRSDHIAPGTKWEYSNTGYFLLGHVVELACGMALRAYVARHLLDRVGLPSVFRSTRNAERDATGHMHGTDGFRTVAAPSRFLAFGSGDLCASADTLAKWEGALWGDDLLSASSRAVMRRPGTLTNGTETAYGLGVYVADFEGHAELSHDGNTAGFSSQVAWYPDAQLSVAVLMNSQAHFAENLEKELSSIMLGIAMTADDATRRSAVSALPYVGQYSYGTQSVAIETSAAGIVVRSPTGRRALLTPLDQHLFAEADDPAMHYMFRIEKGRAVSFHVMRFSKELGIAERVDGHRHR